MKIVINIEKRHFFIILAFVLMVGGIITVRAYGTDNPSNFGHTMNETEGLDRDGNQIVDDAQIQRGPTIINFSHWYNDYMCVDVVCT